MAERVGIELASIWRPGGVSDRRVAQGLLQGLREIAPACEHDIVVAVDSHAPDDAAEQLGFETVRFRSGQRLITNRLQLVRAYERAGVDVGLFHHFRPRRWSGRSCTLIHDIIHHTHPDAFGRVSKFYLDGRRTWGRGHGAVITVSDHSRSEIINHGYAEPDECHVIHWGADTADMPELDRAPDANHPLFVVVGRITSRKRPGFIADAFSRAGSPGRLVFAGPIEDQSLATELSSIAGVTVLGHVPDEELEQLFATASCSIVASKAEGFGMQIVESLARGVPTLAADIPAFAEIDEQVGGCTFFGVNDVDELAAQIRVLAEGGASTVDPALVLEVYSWASSATRLLEIMTDDSRT